MGVVYKAEDTKLKRLVALKFLPSSIMASEAEKTRFIHEAQAAAALNHPNICTIYEINEIDGQAFIAMEFIEGHSLKEKIESGPLQLDEALGIAMQVAEGLQAAHEKQITHRDIKPANIMFTPKGQVKIMDFGLAKLAGRSALTKEGATLGTVAYMSPEQARGEEVDHRTDIWSFGVVLYEMISGQLPFKGEYDQAVVYLILNVEPEPMIPTASGRTDVPMELERIVNKELAKKANERYQHVEDLLVDLRGVQTRAKSIIAPTPAKEPKRKQPLLYGPLRASLFYSFSLVCSFGRKSNPRRRSLPLRCCRLRT
jgi:serine/threonine protein kinase